MRAGQVTIYIPDGHPFMEFHAFAFCTLTRDGHLVAFYDSECPSTEIIQTTFPFVIEEDIPWKPNYITSGDQRYEVDLLAVNGELVDRIKFIELRAISHDCQSIVRLIGSERSWIVKADMVVKRL